MSQYAWWAGYGCGTIVAWVSAWYTWGKKLRTVQRTVRRALDKYEEQRS